MATTGDRREIERKLRALAGDGFNADFEELVIEKVVRMMRAGLSKENILRLLDFTAEAKEKINDILK